MTYPIISIITVVYNAYSTLEATIKSVVSQKKELFEYWIIDGGSTDGSVEIIQKYEHQLAGWVSEPDRGIYDAMNKGIDRAQGDWIYFLGADDLMTEGILSKVSPYLQANFSVVYGDVKFNSGHLMHSHLDIRCILDNTLHHQSAFYHRRLFDGFRYNQKFSVYADYELTLRMYVQKQPALYVPYIISIFMIGGKSHELVSTEINAIRSIYLRNSLLNTLLSFILNKYYRYVSVRRRITHKLRKVLKLERDNPVLKNNYVEI